MRLRLQRLVRVGSRPGVTIPEMLVAMSIVAIVSAVVLPNVLRHLDEAETSRLVNDIQAAGEAARMFRTHVRRWPANVPHLVEAPQARAVDVLGNEIPGRLLDDWKGPYIELKKVADVSGEVNPVILTARGSYIRNDFSAARWRGHLFLQVEVAQMDVKHARLVSQVLDGDTTMVVTDVEAENDAAGRVRFVPSGTGQAGSHGSLLYLAARID